MNAAASHIPPSELPPVVPNQEQAPQPAQSPNAEKLPANQETEQQFGLSREQASSVATPLPPAPATTPLSPTQVMPAAPATAAPATGQPASLPASQMIADDTDLIEKEWVVKAKQIVTSTRDDPYQQNREVNKLKADYVKARYNKDIKLSDN